MLQRLGRAQTGFRVRVEQFAHEALGGIRDLEFRGTRELELGFADFAEELVEVAGVLERGAAKEELKGDAAEGPEVDFGGVAAAFYDFWRQVLNQKLGNDR